jgi:hypothetical protein
MRLSIAPTACMLAGLVLGCAAVAAGQDAGSSQSAGSGASTSAGAPTAGGASLSDQTGSVLANTSVGAMVSGVTANASSNGPSAGSGMSASGGGRSLFGVSSAGWGMGASASRGAAVSSASASPGSSKAAARTLAGSGVSASLAAKSSGGPASAGIGHAGSSQQTVPGVIASSPGQSARNSESTPPGGSGPGGNASYSAGFPDSTKGTAALSPLDYPESPLGGFDPSIDYSLPDFGNREFLALSLHVGGTVGVGGSAWQKLDAYQRIEQRLREYRTGGHRHRKTASSRHKQYGQTSRSDPFAQKPLDSGLKF